MSSFSLFSFCKLVLITSTLATSAQGASTSALYTNSSRLSQEASALWSTSAAPLNDFIIQGLGGVASSSSASASNASATSYLTSWPGVQHFSEHAPLPTDGPTTSTASSKTKVTMSGDVFTKARNPRDSPEAVSKAQQCWSEILTWSSSSYSWYQASVAGKVWPLLTSATPDIGLTYWTSTYYPVSPSVYTLCDGSPRADAKPFTTTTTINTTYSTHQWKTLATPTFRPQPCTPSGQDCHIWYTGSGIKEVNEDSLLKLCGNPVHGDQGQCVFGIDGAVELIYFPVKTANGSSLCTGNASTISQGPTATTGHNVVTYLGRTFTSGSAYISIKSLSAYYDGYGYTVGPNFSDLILTLKSEDISTQCQGAKTSTRMNFADLNYPVPASAYNCQLPCGQVDVDKSTAAECATIWDNFDPLLAIPTQITDLSPLWATCKLDVPSLGNYWIDPPIALQEQHTVAAATMASSLIVVTTPAAPSSKPTNPAATSTSAPTASLELLTALPSAKTSTRSTESTVSAKGSATLKPISIESSKSPEVIVPSPAEATASANAVVTDESIPILSSGSVESGIPSPTETVANKPSFVFNPIDSQVPAPGEEPQLQSSLDPVIATAAGFSVLTQALASFTDNDPAATVSPNIVSASNIPEVIVTHASSEVPAAQTDGYSTPNSPMVASGKLSTASDTEPSTESGSPVEGNFAIPTSPRPKPTATRTAYVIAPGSFTLSATPIEGDSGAVQVGTATLSVGGPAVTVSGQVLTNAASDIVLLPSGSRPTQLPSVIRTDGAVVMAAGGHTVTAVIIPGEHTAYSVGGTTLSLGGGAAVIQNATFTVGPGGLGVIRSHSANLTTTKLPSVLSSKTTTSTRSRWSSTASTVPTTTSSGGSREGMSWAQIVLISGTLMCLLCI